MSGNNGRLGGGDIGRHDTAPVNATDPTLSPLPPRWDAIDIVLLDLDGTLLDLSFDNRFWLQLVPQAYARLHGLTPEQAYEAIEPRFKACEGTLDWYSIDHWTRQLGLDIRALKRADSASIRWLPGALDFLAAVRRRGKRLVLLTNSHPATLEIKDAAAGVKAHFDATHSSGTFGAPKEDPRFWEVLQQVEPFDVRRAMFVDDSQSVLRAARAAGIASIYAIRRPDRSQDARVHREFASVDAIVELS